MTQQISITLEYDKYIDIRFLSNFLYHLKTLTTYIYKKEKSNFYVKELINFINEISLNFDKRRTFELDEILNYLSNNPNFQKMYTDYIRIKNKYNLFVSKDSNIEILTIEKGSVEFIVISLSLSIFILASATAYKIIKSKEVNFEIPKIIKIKAIDEKN